MALIEFNFISGGNSGLNIIKDYFIPFIAPAITAFVAWKIFINGQKEERQRWINDVYIKEEAKLWIKFYGKFSSASSDFIELIKHLDVPSLYDEIPQTKFQKYSEQYFELWKLLEEMKPYFNQEIILDFNKLRVFIRNIMIFYSELSEKFHTGDIKYKKDDFPHSKEMFLVSNKTEIKEYLAFRSYFLYHIEYNLESEQLDKIIDCYEKDINEILDELSKKIIIPKIKP